MDPFEEAPYFGTPKLCHILLRSYTTVFWKFQVLKLSREKFQIWKIYFKETPYWGTPKFRHILCFVILTYHRRSQGGPGARLTPNWNATSDENVTKKAIVFFSFSFF